MKNFLKFWDSLPKFLTATATLLGAIVGLLALYNGNQPTTRAGYKEHEHPFYYNEKIKSMKQEEANDFCSERFDKLDNDDFKNLRINGEEVNHIWGYRLKGACVAYTPQN